MIVNQFDYYFSFTYAGFFVVDGVVVVVVVVVVVLVVGVMVVVLIDKVGGGIGAGGTAVAVVVGATEDVDVDDPDLEYWRPVGAAPISTKESTEEPVESAEFTVPLF